MAKIKVAGYTATGVTRQMNEDTFALQKTIYPNSLSGYEQATHETMAFLQSYNITYGFGGSGIGDIAGRIAQRIIQNELDHLSQVDRNANLFPKWANNLALLCQRGVAQQLHRYSSLPVGCSHAGVFVVNNTAYFMSNGGNVMMLSRGGELYTMGEQDIDEQGRPNSYFGHMAAHTGSDAYNLSYIDLEPGDLVILASLGAVAALSPSEIQEQINARTTIQSLLRNIYRAGLMKQITYNQTMIVLEVESLETAPMPLSEQRQTRLKDPTVITEISDHTVTLPRHQEAIEPKQMVSPFGEVIELIGTQELRQNKDTRQRDQWLLYVCGGIVLVLLLILIWPLLF